ncbi:hypothetical protein SLEP1_g3649 [Rubroshorea leprosula]|uniref:Uncharacterized protein n=1 Tax=Rubroshorea leprosula TaxID=152421 RepID=A0AAV5HLL4_9ROSI|nr:hypothetical protein SLEP1_g3649 [Rubroshorea leprosula]
MWPSSYPLRDAVFISSSMRCGLHLFFCEMRSSSLLLRDAVFISLSSLDVVFI